MTIVLESQPENITKRDCKLRQMGPLVY